MRVIFDYRKERLKKFCVDGGLASILILEILLQLNI